MHNMSSSFNLMSIWNSNIVLNGNSKYIIVSFFLSWTRVKIIIFSKVMSLRFINMVSSQPVKPNESHCLLIFVRLNAEPRSRAPNRTTRAVWNCKHQLVQLVLDYFSGHVKSKSRLDYFCD